VYDDCLAWLKRIRAEINEQTHPVYIKAHHDKSNISKGISTPVDWPKILMINMEKHIDDVIIRIRIDSIELSSHINRKRHYYWLLIVEDLLRIFFNNMNPILKHLYDNENGEKLYNDLKMGAIKWFALTIIPSLFLVIGGPSFYKIAGIFYFIVFFSTGWSSIGKDFFRIRGFLSQLHPDK
jgi:hypothetical protein